jgi:hypothetical protein
MSQLKPEHINTYIKSELHRPHHLENKIFPQITNKCHFGPEVDSASNRNEYQEYFLGVKATGA